MLLCSSHQFFSRHREPGLAPSRLSYDRLLRQIVTARGRLAKGWLAGMYMYAKGAQEGTTVFGLACRSNNSHSDGRSAASLYVVVVAFLYLHFYISKSRSDETSTLLIRCPTWGASSHQLWSNPAPLQQVALSYELYLLLEAALPLLLW